MSITIVSRTTGQIIVELNLDTLRGADLRSAYLRFANLCEADLCESNLREADLREADLCFADLRGADLREADLREADLVGANLRGSKTDPFVSDMCSILPEGNLIVWKSLRDGVLAKLSIPAEARRSNSTGRKCRSEYADVLQIIGGDGIVGKSKRDEYFLYRVGERVYCDKWDDDRWNECSGGIHFFITQEEARLYEC